MTITVYSFEDADGNDVGTFTTQDYEEAKRHARANGYRVMGIEFEFSERVPLDDFTESEEEDDDEHDDDRP